MLVNKRFKVSNGLDSLDGNGLGQVLEGLKNKREEKELQTNILALVEEQGSAAILQEHLAAKYEGKEIDSLKTDELREVVAFLTDTAPVF